MGPLRRGLLALALWCLAGAAAAIDGTHAGAWWNPERGGEGIFFEVVEDGDGVYVVAYFFTYDDRGRQAYLVADGRAAADADTVTLATNLTSGGDFGDDFDPAAIRFSAWGTLTARFEGCDRLVLAFDGAFAGNSSGAGQQGEIVLRRFKSAPRGVAGACAAASAEAGQAVSVVDGAAYGAWWNPTRGGEGVFLEIWEDAQGLPQVFAAWFTYTPDGTGRQRWIVGEGPLVGNRADLTAIITGGPSFGDAYDAAAVSFERWGYFSIRFVACGAVEVHYDAAGHGRGVLELEPFVLPIAGAPDCREDLLDFRDQVIYFALTDRFANGDPTNDDGDGARSGDAADPTNPLGWHGGDFAGIVERIEAGYFTQLGITTLWISPIPRQVASIPTGSGPNQGREFAGYHAYWADDLAGVEPHFGSPAELVRLVSTAHRHGLRVILDTVVNHVGYGSRLERDRPDWLRTGSACTSTDTGLCLAGLPDFRQELEAVTAYLNGKVAEMMTKYGFDGMRMDTMKHVNDAYWRQFFVRGGAGDPARWWTVGEVFDEHPGRLGYYQDELGSPSVFDFALRRAILDSLAYGRGVARIADVFRSDASYDDPTRLTTFIDNHDVWRFVTEAENGGATPSEAEERLDQALTLIFLARGIPSIYYGTEIALRGFGDPYDNPRGESNREDMDFGALATSSFDERIATLARARRDHPALRYGTQETVSVNAVADLLVFARRFGDGPPILGVLNAGNAPADLGLAVGGGLDLDGLIPDGTDLVELTGRDHGLMIQGGRLTGRVPPRSMLGLRPTE